MNRKIKIPKRSERIRLIKKGAKNLDEWLLLAELEKMVKDRLTEKLLITVTTLMWLIFGLCGRTAYCALWGIPLAFITLFIGVWIL